MRRPLVAPAALVASSPRRPAPSGRGDEHPDRLAGGPQRRVAIVHALAIRLQLVPLDEVTSALDPELVPESLNAIRELGDKGMRMPIATREMGFARDIADRVCLPEAGVILEQGPSERVCTAPAEPPTRRFLARIVEAGRL